VWNRKGRLSLDLDGEVLDISLGSELLSNGNLAANANGRTFNDPYNECA
jgi:hypothetical protein